MKPYEAAALAAIDAEWAETITYSGAGLAQPTELTVLWSDDGGEPFTGAGNTTRTISCEINKALLPLRPSTDDRIQRAGVTWAPNNVVDRDDIDRWVIILKRRA